MTSGAVNTRAAVLYGAKDLRIEDRPLPPPGSGEVQLSISATTLCGSDSHYYSHGANGAFKVLHPYILGHEAGGTVTRVGEGVTEVKVGDGVAIECGMCCGRCARCKEGRYNLCPSMEFKSSAKRNPHSDGTLRTVMNHPASLVHPLPPGVSLLKAALAEPLAVVLHAFNRVSSASVSFAGSSLLVFGAGAIGILTCAVGRSLGFSRVCVVDVANERVDFAVQNGWATEGKALIAKPRAKTTEEGLKGSQETAEEILNEFGAEGFDVVMECSGVEPCIQAGIHCARPGGKLVLVGMGTPIATLPLASAALREVDILGVFRYANCYPAALRLLADTQGPLANVEKIVTHRVGLEESGRAFELVGRGKDEEGRMVVKVAIES